MSGALSNSVSRVKPRTTAIEGEVGFASVETAEVEMERTMERPVQLSMQLTTPLPILQPMLRDVRQTVLGLPPNCWTLC